VFQHGSPALIMRAKFGRMSCRSSLQVQPSSGQRSHIRWNAPRQSGHPRGHGLKKKGWTQRVHPFVENGGLAAQAQRLDCFGVAVFSGDLQVIEELPAAGDHLEQAAAGGVIFGMTRQMLRQMVDTLREQGDLYVGTASVLLVQLEGIKGGGLDFAHVFVRVHRLGERVVLLRINFGPRRKHNVRSWQAKV